MDVPLGHSDVAVSRDLFGGHKINAAQVNDPSQRRVAERVQGHVLKSRVPDRLCEGFPHGRVRFLGLRIREDKFGAFDGLDVTERAFDHAVSFQLNSDHS